MDRQLLKEARVLTNEDYRQYLQSQADNVITVNQNNACSSVSTLCNVSDHSIPSFACNTPYMYKLPSSRAKPLGYEDSDLKRDYLAKYRAAASLSRIHIDTEEMHELKGMFATNNRLT